MAESSFHSDKRLFSKDLIGAVRLLSTFKNFFHPGNILRQIDFRGIVLGNDHLYSMSVFNGPQLFEFFDLFKGSFRKGSEYVQKASGIGIKPKVFVTVEA